MTEFTPVHSYAEGKSRAHRMQPTDEEIARKLAQAILVAIRSCRARETANPSEKATPAAPLHGMKGMPLAPKTLYSRKEAAAALALSVRTLDVLIGRGTLRVVHLGRRVLIHRDEVEKCGRKLAQRDLPAPTKARVPESLE